MTRLAKPVQMAVIGAAHGIKGEVRVRSFTDDPLALGDYGPLQAKDGRVFEVAGIRPQGKFVVARFANVADRSAAEALSGLELFVERSALSDDLDEEEFYHADLVDLEVRDDTGVTIGRVKAVQNFGAGDILEIRRRHGGDLFVPFTKAAAPEVSVADGYVRLDPIAAGLVDEDEPAEPPERGDDAGSGS